MPDQALNRRLAAILVADVVGYTRLIETAEASTVAAMLTRRREILDPAVARHGGRIMTVAGDGMLVEFASAVGAVAAAIDVQNGFESANASLPDERRMRLRIGIDLGEVVGEGGDIFGSGVNIAARLEQLCEPGGICASLKIMQEVRGKLDAVFIDQGDHILKNIAAPVRAFAVRQSKGDDTGPAPPLGSAKRSSIAVLPFASADPSQQYLADGITEDITTELSRFKGLSVAARLAAFHFASQGLGIDQLARQLGASFLVQGSMRKMGPRLRVTAQLVEVGSGSQIWAERYDRNAEDIFGVQDEVVASIVTSLEGRMTAAGAASARRKPTASWSAYDCLLQGRELTNEYREPEAIPHFRRAIALDPNFALAHAWLAVALTISDMVLVDASQFAEADGASLRALELDEGDATAHWARALVLHWSGNYQSAGGHFDRAMQLNPSDVAIQGDYANWQRMSGQSAAALATIDRAVALGPFVPRWFGAVRGEVLFDLGRYQEAVRVLEAVPDHYVTGCLHLAAARAMMGDREGAATARDRALALRPELTVAKLSRHFRYMDEASQRHFVDALRLAGLPD